MGRKKENNSGKLYFSHDFDARLDRKCIALNRKFPLIGYGIYWVVVELLRDSDNYRLRNDKETIEEISFNFGWVPFKLRLIRNVLNFCINRELFKLDDEGYFYSSSLIDRMEIVDNLSKKRRNAVNNRYKNDDVQNSTFVENETTKIVQNSTNDVQNSTKFYKSSTNENFVGEIKNQNQKLNIKNQFDVNLNNNKKFDLSVDKLNSEWLSMVQVLKYKFVDVFRIKPYPYFDNEKERENKYRLYDNTIYSLVAQVKGHIDPFLKDLEYCKKQGSKYDSILPFIFSKHGASRWEQTAFQLHFDEHEKLKQEWKDAIEGNKAFETIRLAYNSKNEPPDWVQESVNELKNKMQLYKYATDNEYRQELKRGILYIKNKLGM